MSQSSRRKSSPAARVWRKWLLTHITLIVLTTTQALAEEEQALTVGLLTVDQLETELRRLEANETLDDKTKTSALELLQSAKEQITAGERHRELAEKLSAASRAIPVELRDLKDSVQQEPPFESIPDQVTLATKKADELRSNWLQMQAELASLESELREFEERLATKNKDLDNAHERLTQVQEEADEAKLQQNRQAATGESETVYAARQRFLESRVQALSLENRKLTQQIATHPLRFELLQAKRDRLAAEVNAKRQAVRSVEEILNKRQLFEAQAEEKEAAAPCNVTRRENTPC